MMTVIIVSPEQFFWYVQHAKQSIDEDVTFREFLREKGIDSIPLTAFKGNWCRSSSEGNGNIQVAKWDTVANQIQNKHRHKDKLFPRCKHGRLTGREKKDVAEARWAQVHLNMSIAYSP